MAERPLPLSGRMPNPGSGLAYPIDKLFGSVPDTGEETTSKTMNDPISQNVKQAGPTSTAEANASTFPTSDMLDELYARWQEDQREPRPLTLKEWSASYPSYKDELIEWTSVGPLMDGFEESEASDEDRAQVEGALKEALARRLQAWNVSNFSATSGDLYTLAKEQGLKPRDLAVTLGIGMEIVAKLHSRLIRFATIPAPFLHALTEALQTSHEQVSALLDQPPMLAHGALYKADGVPQVGQTDAFETAIQASRTMTEAQKRRWLEPGE